MKIYMVHKVDEIDNTDEISAVSFSEELAKDYLIRKTMMNMINPFGIIKYYLNEIELA